MTTPDGKDMSDETRRLPLSAALHVFRRHLNALKRAPSAEDILTMLRRLGEGDEVLSEANAALGMLRDPRDTRHLYLVLATLHDELVREQLGQWPPHAISAITSAIQRLSPHMQPRIDFSNPALQEELFRQVAAQLGCRVDEESADTSEFLLQEMDSVLQQMHAKQREYAAALERAKQAIDQAHRPARPYGE